MADDAVLLLSPLILFEDLEMQGFSPSQPANKKNSQVNQGGSNQYIPLQ